MSDYKKRILQARKAFINLNFEQEKELFKIYSDAADKLIGKILNMTDSRTKIHNIETYKVINEYKTELYNNLNKTIENNILKSSDIQKGVQLSFVDMIAPDVKTNEALKRTVTKISNDTVKQLIAGEYYKDGKTLSKRIWNLTGNNGNKIDTIIKDNIAKGANVRELAKELDKYVNPKNRITPKTFADGIGGDDISYQARRLARTSITHAQTETMIQNAKKNPFCKGLKWNLSASHSVRMHGKKDICDDYNGKTFKPEEVPLQHPNCLCYFTEVLEDFDKCIEDMKAWSNGESNSRIDEWVKDGDDKTSVKITTPKEIQTKFKIDTINKENDNKTTVINQNVRYNDNKNTDIIKSDSKINKVSNVTYTKSNIRWNEQLGISKENSDKLNEIHTKLNKFMNENKTEKLMMLSLSKGNVLHELTSNKEEEVNLSKETIQILKNSQANDIVFVHNHPTETTFSRYDIYQLIKYKSIKAMTIECIGGSKFILERGKMRSTFLNNLNFPSKYEEIYWKVAEKYPELDDEVKRYEVWDKFLDEVTKEIAKLYGMNYKEVIE